VTNTKSGVVNCQGNVSEFHNVWKVGTLFIKFNCEINRIIQRIFKFMASTIKYNHITFLLLFAEKYKSFSFSCREKPVKVHLKNVYGTMGLALLSCAVGGYIHIFTNIFSVCICANVEQFIYIFVYAYGHKMAIKTIQEGYSQ
jgi:hypothetical protein